MEASLSGFDFSFREYFSFKGVFFHKKRSYYCNKVSVCGFDVHSYCLLSLPKFSINVVILFVVPLFMSVGRKWSPQLQNMFVDLFVVNWGQL